MPKRKPESQIENLNKKSKTHHFKETNQTTLHFFQFYQMSGKVNKTKMLWERIEECVKQKKYVEAIRLCEQGYQVTKPKIASPKDVGMVYEETIDSYINDRPVDHIEFIRKEKELIEFLLNKKLFDKLKTLLFCENVENPVTLLSECLDNPWMIDVNRDFINYIEENVKDVVDRINAEEVFEENEKIKINYNFLYLYLTVRYDQRTGENFPFGLYKIFQEKNRLIQCVLLRFELFRDYFLEESINHEKNIKELSDKGLLFASNCYVWLESLTEKEENYICKKLIVESGMLFYLRINDWLNEQVLDKGKLGDRETSRKIFDKIHFGLSCTECAKRLLDLFYYADKENPSEGIFEELDEITQYFSATSLIAELIKIIYQKGLEINTSEFCKQVTHYIFAQQDIQAIRLLIEAGVDINHLDDPNDVTPVHAVFFSGKSLKNFLLLKLPSLDLFKVLLDHNADFDSEIEGDWSVRKLIEIRTLLGQKEALELMAFWYVNSENKEPIENFIKEITLLGFKEKFDLYVESFEAQKAEVENEESQVTLQM